MTIMESGGWTQQGHGKFWHAKAPKRNGGNFLRAEGRPKMVAVFDPHRSDYRLKVWLDEVITANITSTIDEVEFLFTHKKNSLWEATTSNKILWAMLHGEEPDDDTPEEADELLDCCIETQFDRAVSGRLAGRVDDFPEWMQATGIDISADGRGQGTSIYLRSNLNHSHRAFQNLMQLRINGHWLTGMPMDGGRVYFSVPPPIEDEIRNYGDGLTDIGIPDEVRPPRTRASVRAVCVFLRDHGTRNTDHWHWRDDVMKMQYRVHGMCVAFGQRGMYEFRHSEYSRRKQHWDGLIKKYYAKRPEALKDLSVEKWITTDKRYRGWAANSKRLDKALEDIDKQILRFHKIYEEQHAEWRERLARCEAREAQFADAIALTHPRG